MLRVSSVAVCLLLVIGAAACDRETPLGGQPDVKMGELMPAGTPEFDSSYLGAQTEVKLLPERTLSYDALETFRAKNIETARKNQPKPKSARSGDKSAGERNASGETPSSKATSAAPAGGSAGGGKLLKLGRKIAGGIFGGGGKSADRPVKQAESKEAGKDAAGESDEDDAATTGDDDDSDDSDEDSDSDDESTSEDDTDDASDDDANDEDSDEAEGDEPGEDDDSDDE